MNTPAHSHSAVGLILRAASFAADKHRAQRRKGGDLPYINHPLAVAELLWETGRVHDPVVIAAAILHDTLEDTETTPAELAEHFGAEVRDLVLEVTEDPALPRGGRKDREREHALALSPRARLVRLADKAHNLFSLIDHPPLIWDPAKQSRYAEWCGVMGETLAGTNPAIEAFLRESLARARRAIGLRRDAAGAGV